MQNESLTDLLQMFQNGSGFGDPEARRNAELRLQVLLAEGQRKTQVRLNVLTVIVSLLNILILAFQLLGW